MGNRTIITIEQNGATHPVAIYVHWNGGLESVLAFVEYTFENMKTCIDLYDFHARLTQVLGNFFGDGLSMYCYPASDVWHVARGCDNGHFHFDLTRDDVKLVMHDGNADPEYVSRIVGEARAHKYWTADETIFDMIRQAQPGQQMES